MGLVVAVAVAAVAAAAVARAECALEPEASTPPLLLNRHMDARQGRIIHGLEGPVSRGAAGHPE